MRTLPSKLRPHHQHRPNRSRLKDAKRGWLKTRMHPGALHGPLKKKLHCVKFGFTYSAIGNVRRESGFWNKVYVHANVMRKEPMSGAEDEDYFAKALLNYEAEYEVPFTLCHSWEVLRKSLKWMDSEVLNFEEKKINT
ncbi:hypothetical protein Tco_1379620 [Tanacetum coccineum]